VADGWNHDQAKKIADLRVQLTEAQKRIEELEKENSKFKRIRDNLTN